MDTLSGETFDLIVNATSSGIDGDVPAIPASIVNADVYCYDMFYQKGRHRFFTGASNMAQSTVPMGWECWWRKPPMLFCYGTAFCRLSPGH